MKKKTNKKKKPAPKRTSVKRKLHHLEQEIKKAKKPKTTHKPGKKPRYNGKTHSMSFDLMLELPAFGKNADAEGGTQLLTQRLSPFARSSQGINTTTPQSIEMCKWKKYRMRNVSIQLIPMHDKNVAGFTTTLYYVNNPDASLQKFDLSAMRQLTMKETLCPSRGYNMRIPHNLMGMNASQNWLFTQVNEHDPALCRYGSWGVVIHGKPVSALNPSETFSGPLYRVRVSATLEFILYDTEPSSAYISSERIPPSKVNFSSDAGGTYAHLPYKALLAAVQRTREVPHKKGTTVEDETGGSSVMQDIFETCFRVAEGVATITPPPFSYLLSGVAYFGRLIANPSQTRLATFEGTAHILKMYRSYSEAIGDRSIPNVPDLPSEALVEGDLQLLTPDELSGSIVTSAMEGKHLTELLIIGQENRKGEPKFMDLTPMWTDHPAFDCTKHTGASHLAVTINGDDGAVNSNNVISFMAGPLVALARYSDDTEQKVKIKGPPDLEDLLGGKFEHDRLFRSCVTNDEYTWSFPCDVIAEFYFVSHPPTKPRVKFIEDLSALQRANRPTKEPELQYSQSLTICSNILIFDPVSLGRMSYRTPGLVLPVEDSMSSNYDTFFKNTVTGKHLTAEIKLIPRRHFKSTWRYGPQNTDDVYDKIEAFINQLTGCSLSNNPVSPIPDKISDDDLDEELEVASDDSEILIVPHKSNKKIR